MKRFSTQQRASLTLDELESRWCPAIADLAVTNSDGFIEVLDGTTFTPIITVTNNGPEAANAVAIVDYFPTIPFTNITWTATAAGGAFLPLASGFGSISVVATLPVGGSVTFTVRVSTLVRGNGEFVHTAVAAHAAVPPTGTSDADPNPANNSATDATLIGHRFVPDSSIASRLYATGSDAGTPGDVRVYDSATGQLKYSFQPFGATFHGGVRVSTGDVTGDGRDDVVVGAGPGAGPHVKVYEGFDLRELASFFAFDPGFTGGVYVAAARFNVPGPGFSRLIPGHVVVGAGAGADPHVTVFRVENGHASSDTFLASFLAYDAGFRGGVRVGAGNVDGQPGDELITGAGPGGLPHVKVFNRDGAMTASFLAYAARFAGGVYVTAGNTDGVAGNEIVTGAGAGSHVKIFTTGDGTEKASFFAIPGFNGEARVAVTDRDGDGSDDLVLGVGPGAGPHVRIVSGLSLLSLDSFFAYDAAFAGGVFVG